MKNIFPVIRKVCLIVLAAGIILLFLALNILAHWLLAFVIGKWLSTLAIAAVYYFGARYLI
jgi:hypothetical protein